MAEGGYGIKDSLSERVHILWLLRTGKVTQLIKSWSKWKVMGDVLCVFYFAVCPRRSTCVDYIYRLLYSLALSWDWSGEAPEGAQRERGLQVTVSIPVDPSCACLSLAVFLTEDHCSAQSDILCWDPDWYKNQSIYVGICQIIRVPFPPKQ